MAIRGLASMALAAVSKGMSAVLPAFSNTGGGFLKPLIFKGEVLIGDLVTPSHLAIALRIKKSKNCKLYHAAKAYFLAKTQGQGIQPIRITGKKLPSELEWQGKKVNWLYLSPDDGSDSAWYEFNEAGVRENVFYDLCSGLKPALRKELLGCSTYTSMVTHAAERRPIIQHGFLEGDHQEVANAVDRHPGAGRRV